MTDEIDHQSADEIVYGSQDYMRYLEECDSQICDYDYYLLMDGSVMLYDFRDKV
jgi:hypothetical protein